MGLQLPTEESMEASEAEATSREKVVSDSLEWRSRTVVEGVEGAAFSGIVR
jgi:hypothetical protein